MAKTFKQTKRKPLSDEKEAELLIQLSQYHDSGEKGSLDVFSRMSRCERYAVGQQWDKDVLDANKARRKFSLTINRIFPIINQLSGFDAKNPKDFIIKNLKGGTQKGAELLSALAKHTIDQSHAVRQQNQCFEDGIRCTRGFLEADVDYDEDPIKGNIIVAKLDPFMVIPDPSCKSYNYNDLENGAKYIIIEKWMDKQYIRRKYPTKTQELGDDETTSRRFTGMFTKLTSWMFGDKSLSDTKTSYRDMEIGLDQSQVDYSEYKFRISKYYWKTFEEGVLVVKDGNTLNAMTLTDPKDIAFARKVVKELEERAAMMAEEMAASGQQQQSGQQPGQQPQSQYPQIEIIEADKNGNPIIIPVLHRSIMAGEVLLDYRRDPFNGMNLFPIVRFSPYFISGYEFSVVENLIGSQDRVNWSASMELNIIRKLANTGWKIARDVAGTFAQWLQDHGSEDGIVIEESKGGGAVSKLEQTAIPQGYAHISATASEDISSISQVQLKAPDDNQTKESGRSVLAKQNWSLQNTSNLGSNWDFTQELLGEIILGIIRHAEVYSEEEVMAIVDEQELIDEELMNQARQKAVETMSAQGIPALQPPEKPDVMVLQGENPGFQKATLFNYKKQAENFAAYMKSVDEIALPIAKAMLIDLITTVKYGRYGVKVELAPHAETNRMRRTAETFELNAALIESGQPGVSRNLLIDATDIFNKDAIKEEMPQVPAQAGAGQGPKAMAG